MPTIVFAQTVGAPSPKFGTSCVCCNADAGGKTVTRTVRHHERQKKNIELVVPVCAACEPHVFDSTGAGYYAIPAAVVAGLMTLGAAGYNFFTGHGVVQEQLLIAAGGTVVTSGGILGFISRKARLDRERERGHAPALGASIYFEQLAVSSDNETLIKALLEQHPDAKLGA